MKLVLQRLWHTKTLATGNYTCGFLSCEGFRSFSLEDTFHPQKIAGDTRIPAGFYELGLRKENTPLTIKHREAYKAMPWFKANPGWFHIEVLKIPNYSGAYIHSGNDNDHTLGCILPAYAFDISLVNNQSSKSLLAVNDLYQIIYPLLESGSKCHIEIRDEQ